MRHWQKKFLEKSGIVRHVMKQDLLFFFLPFLTAICLELIVCEIYGDGFTGIWGALWELIKQPQTLFVLPWNRAVGPVLFVMGLTIMIVSQATLWRNYSGFVVIKKDHQLITHGIYRFIRNPIYLGVLIAFTGLPLYAASLYGFLIMFVMIPIFLNRIRMEEKLLVEEFQDAFRNYKKTTKKLIPFIY